MSFEERSPGHMHFDTADERKAYLAGLHRAMNEVEEFASVRTAKALERIAAVMEKALSFYCGKWEVRGGKVTVTLQEEPPK